MSFVSNSYQQISLFDKLAFLSGRKQQMLEKSWAQAFSKHARKVMSPKAVPISGKVILYGFLFRSAAAITVLTKRNVMQR